MQKQPISRLSVLTRTLMMVYFASAVVFAVMLLWLLANLISHGFAAAGYVVSPPPGLLLIGACLLMLTAKIAGGWAYRREVREVGR
jgi:hypothetical protein